MNSSGAAVDGKSVPAGAISNETGQLRSPQGIAVAAVAMAGANSNGTNTSSNQIDNNNLMMCKNNAVNHSSGGSIVALNNALTPPPPPPASNNNHLQMTSSAPTAPPSHGVSLTPPFSHAPFGMHYDPATAALIALNPHAMAAQAAVAAHAAIASAAHQMVQQQKNQQAHQQQQAIHLQQQHSFFGSNNVKNTGVAPMNAFPNVSPAPLNSTNHSNVSGNVTNTNSRSTGSSFATKSHSSNNVLPSPSNSSNLSQDTGQSSSGNTSIGEKNSSLSGGNKRGPSPAVIPTASSGNSVIPQQQATNNQAKDSHGAIMQFPPLALMNPPARPTQPSQPVAHPPNMCSPNVSAMFPVGYPMSNIAPPGFVPSGAVNRNANGGYKGVPGGKTTSSPVAVMPLVNPGSTLEQLEANVRMLQENNQPIPQPLVMLLADARRREEKKKAKRVANRKSACTSRARKKAFVEEMARTNARLRRQALILALLPDLVVAIDVDGTITFCSAQVERVLRHKCEDLVGANIEDVLVPASREAVRRLIEELVAAEEADGNNAKGSGVHTIKEGNPNENAVENAMASLSSGAGGDSCTTNNGAAIVVSDQSQSEQPFPLSVVRVKSKMHMDNVVSGSSGGNDDSNEHGEEEKAQSSSINTSLSRSASSFGSRSGSNNPSSSDDSGVDAASSDVPNPSSGAATQPSSSTPQERRVDPKHARQQRKQTGGSSSDDSSSACARASEALNRNVKSHNAMLCKEKSGRTSAHKDDVTGQAVTANNAEARLSSLRHQPNKEEGQNLTGKEKKSSLTYETLMKHSSCSDSSESLLSGGEEKRPGNPANNVNVVRDRDGGHENSSDDSGYREGDESFPSREESESTDDCSSNCKYGRRLRPLSPTCNVCLIREDLTTIWCEVTSSIRTRVVSNEVEESGGSDPNTTSNETSSSSNKPCGVSSSASLSSGSKASSASGSKPKKIVDAAAAAAVAASPPPKKTRELLLCLRPIRDGQEKVAEAFRFRPAVGKSTHSGQQKMIDSQEQESKPERPAASVTVSNMSSGGRTSDDCASKSNSTSSTINKDSSSPPPANNNTPSNRPPKKRPLESPSDAREKNGDGHVHKKTHVSAPPTEQNSALPIPSPATSTPPATDSEKSVVESLMFLSNR